MKVQHMAPASPAQRRPFSARWRFALSGAALFALVWSVLPMGGNLAAGLGRPALPTPRVAPSAAASPALQALPPIAWQAPSSGSVYVVDPSASGDTSRLTLVDTRAGTVSHVAQLDGNPMIARVSVDRLVTASTKSGVDRLTLIDTRDGSVVRETTIKNRLMTLAAARTMGSSPDGRYLYVLTLEVLAPGVDRFGLATIDLVAGLTLGVADLGRCGVGAIASTADNVIVLCNAEVHILAGPTASVVARTINTNAALTTFGAAALRSDAAGAVALPDGRALLLTAGGQIISLRADSGDIGATGDLGLNGRMILSGQVQSSSDGSRIFVLASTEPERVQGSASELVVVNAGTLRVEQRWSIPASSSLAGTSRDGSRVSVLERSSRTLHVFDTSNGRKIASIGEVGNAPFLAVPAD